MILQIEGLNTNMKDVILLLTALFLGYICFVGVVFLLGRLFFPFLTKEELKQHRMNLKKHKALMEAK